MKYGFEEECDELVLLINPTMSGNKLYIEDFSKGDDENIADSIVEIVIQKHPNVVVEGSAENSIFISGYTNLFIEDLVKEMKGNRHKLVSKDKHLLNIEKEQKKKEKVDFRTITDIDYLINLVKTTPIKQSDAKIILLELPFTKNNLELLDLIIDKVFMKISTREKLMVNLGWLYDETSNFNKIFKEQLLRKNSEKEFFYSNFSLVFDYIRNSKNKEGVEELFEFLNDLLNNYNEYEDLQVQEFSLKAMLKYEG